jgi:hypothetical protein
VIVADQAPAPVDVCRDPGLHYVCPNLVMSRPEELEVRTTPNGRRLLLMENYLHNRGPGRVQFRGHRTAPYRMDAVQVIDRSGGRPPVAVRTGARLTWKYVDRRRGSFWKFQNTARFELWRLDAAGRGIRLTRTGPKLDYCLRDLFRFGRGPAVPRRPVFGACSQRFDASTATLGIAVGWADGYPYDYPQNWIEVTGLRGCFAVLHRGDPYNHVLETSERDNVGHRVVRLPFRRGHQRCPTYRGLAPG